jgi:phage terminase large subunit-like protein
VWAVNWRGEFHWVDGVCKRQLMDKNINDLFRLASKWKLNLQSVGIEVSGQQAGFIPWIQNEMMNRNIYFTLASENNKNSPGIRPATNKMVRFNVILPQFKLGKIKFPTELEFDERIVECMTELRLASANGFRSKHDDFIDTISMLGSLVIWTPSEEIYEEDKAESWDDDLPDGAYSSYIV